MFTLGQAPAERKNGNALDGSVDGMLETYNPTEGTGGVSRGGTGFWRLDAISCGANTAYTDRVSFLSLIFGWVGLGIAPPMADIGLAISRVQA